MNGFDNVVDRLTERLQADPELRAEVANELKGHLEDSAKEYLTAGRGQEEARRDAVRALGDEREVADGLWEGNKKRMIRRRVGRWVAGGTLLSAAGVGTVAVAWGAVLSLGMLLALFAELQPATMGAYAGTWAPRVARYVRAERMATMSAADRAVFDAWKGTPRERLAKARKLAEGAVREDRPLFWANYAVQALAANNEVLSGDPAKVNREALAQAVGVFEAGKRVEPANGFYPMGEAVLLLGASTKWTDAPEGHKPALRYAGQNGSQAGMWFDRYEVVDRRMYERGLAQLHEAAGRAYVDSHVPEFERRRVEGLPPRTRLADEAIRAEEYVAASLSYLNGFRVAQNVAASRVIELAQAGKAGEALQLVSDQRRVTRACAARARALTELLVAAQMYGSSLGQEAIVYEVTGDGPRFERAVTALQAFERDARAADVPEETRRLAQESGILGRLFLVSGTDPAQVDPGPERRAEYAVADQLGVAMLAGVLVILGIWLASGSAWARMSGGRWPGVMFLGWRRLARVVSTAVLVPVGAYLAYVNVPDVGGREWGVSAGWDRLVVEYATVGCAVLILLRLLAEQALVRRAREIGVPWEPPRWGRARLALGAVLAACVVASRIVWHVRAAGAGVFDGAPTGTWGYLLAAVLAGYALSWWSGVGNATGDDGRRLSRWVAPVVVTVLLAAVVPVFRGSYGNRTGQVMTDFARGEIEVIAVLAVAALVAKGMLGWRRAAAAAAATGGMSRGLSMVPAVLGAAVLLVGAAGVTSRAVERWSVARMEMGAGVVRLDQEVEQSRYKSVRERMLAGAEGGGV